MVFYRYIAQLLEDAQVATHIKVSLDHEFVQNTAERILGGVQSICNLNREIWLLLESDCDFYTRHTAKEIEMLENHFNSGKEPSWLRSYLFNYHIPNIGIIKDISPDVVQIINRERIT